MTLMRPMKSAAKRLAALTLLTLTTACGLLNDLSEQGTSPNGGSAAADHRSPEQILRDFLDSWHAALTTTEDATNIHHDTMYALLAPPAKALYPRASFQERYDHIAMELNLKGIAYELGETTHLGGTAATIQYDLELQTKRFGDFQDDDRRAHFQKIPALGWRLAWSTQDILAGLAGKARVEIRSRRGARANIYDHQGRPLVEEDGQVTVLFVAKNDMRSEEACIATLARVLRRSAQAIAQNFLDYSPETYFYVGEIDPDAWDPALQSDCGAGNNGYTRTSSKRAYYGHGAATHLTGYIGPVTTNRLAYWEERGIDASAIVGRAGLEEYYDDILGGAPQHALQIIEPGGIILRELAGKAGSAASPLTLTIDRDLQIIAAQAIADAYNAAENHWGSVAFGATAVVLDVQSGAIRALVSWPSFDPGIFNTRERHSPQSFIIDLYESARQPTLDRSNAQIAPGSVYKIITTAAIAEEDLFDEAGIFPCGHSWDGASYGDTVGTRYDWTYTDELPPTGPIRFSQALTASCNPFFYEYGAQLYQKDANLLVEYAERFGLGARTNYDERLSLEEDRGNNAAPTSVSAAINNAIGQGDVQVTPLQMARAVGAIANDGEMVSPYLVERIGGEDGAPLIHEHEAAASQPLDLSERTLAILQRGMCDVVSDGQLGTAAWVFSGLWAYSLCGKTGTAQSGGYPNAWFVAYTPAEEPRLALAVMVENSHEGALVAAPILRRILDDHYGAARAEWPARWEEEYSVPSIGSGGTGA